MTPSSIRNRIVLFVFACAVVFQLSPRLTASGDDDRRGVDVVFTKWVTNAPNMAGIVSGDIGGGQFVGEILNYSHTDVIDKIEAMYHLNGGTHQLTAHVFVTQNNLRGMATIRGVVTGGPLQGARVRGEYQVIFPCGVINAQNGSSGDVCFQGTLDIERDSDH